MLGLLVTVWTVRKTSYGYDIEVEIIYRFLRTHRMTLLADCIYIFKTIKEQLRCNTFN